MKDGVPPEASQSDPKGRASLARIIIIFHAVFFLWIATSLVIASLAGDWVWLDLLAEGYSPDYVYEQFKAVREIDGIETARNLVLMHHFGFASLGAFFAFLVYRRGGLAYVPQQAREGLIRLIFYFIIAEVGAALYIFWLPYTSRNTDVISLSLLPASYAILVMLPIGVVNLLRHRFSEKQSESAEP